MKTSSKKGESEREIQWQLNTAAQYSNGRATSLSQNIKIIYLDQREQLTRLVNSRGYQTRWTSVRADDMGQRIMTGRARESQRTKLIEYLDFNCQATQFHVRTTEPKRAADKELTSVNDTVCQIHLTGRCRWHGLMNSREPPKSVNLTWTNERRRGTPRSLNGARRADTGVCVTYIFTVACNLSWHSIRPFIHNRAFSSRVKSARRSVEPH